MGVSECTIHNIWKEKAAVPVKRWMYMDVEVGRYAAEMAQPL